MARAKDWRSLTDYTACREPAGSLAVDEGGLNEFHRP